jgi:hypothetical protein
VLVIEQCDGARNQSMPKKKGGCKEKEENK